eukprot:m.233938 g.233938  ORF g.233938 m.233938 type:complete len:286 (-) comp22464_c1_seq3:38-895(-)
MNTSEISGFRFTTSKGHILESRCSKGGAEPCKGELCDFCRADQALKLPLPEETYLQNSLCVTHIASGAEMRFDALAALRQVDATQDLVKVSYAAEWNASRRAHAEKIKDKVDPYDWTFTTDYRGDLIGPWKTSGTDERIDLEALKAREKILFFDVVNMYADDFGDNGAVMMNVRIRVMPSCFFILQRLFVRVDRVLVRVHDTRVYHRFGSDHILREFSRRELSTAELEVRLGGSAASRPPAALYREDQLPALIPLLDLKEEAVEKLECGEPVGQPNHSLSAPAEE